MKKILIIEDDAVTAKVYASLLARNGYGVQVAASIRAGVEQMTEFQPDGVLLDLRLPDSSGMDFLKSVRANDQYKDLPIIVYTNLFVPGMTESAAAAGATKVYDKGTVTPTTIVDTFAGYLRKKDQAEAA